jgi:hypothetical protein
MSAAPQRPADGGPLLALLQRLLQAALTAPGLLTASGGSGVRLAQAEPLPDGARLHLRVQGLGGLLDTTVRLRLTILTVGATHTRCTLALDDAERGGRLGRLLGAGVSGLPRPLLQQALARLAGDAVRLDDAAGSAPGETGLVLDHAALLQRLRG